MAEDKNVIIEVTNQKDASVVVATRILDAKQTVKVPFFNYRQLLDAQAGERNKLIVINTEITDEIIAKLKGEDVPDPEVTTKEVTENIDVVSYETVRNETEELPKGEEEVVQEGVDGYTKVTYEVTYENDVEVSREETGREVIDPINEIIKVGTFEEPETISVTGLTITPKTSTADSGASANRQLNVNVSPENATNKKVTYDVEPKVDGLSVDSNGNLSWTDSVPAGTYTTTVTTEDGGFTDTHKLTLNEPEVEPEGSE